MKVAARSGDQVGVELAVAAPVRVEVDIDAIYAEHAAFLTRVLIRLVGDGAHVDDLVQETFIIAYRKRATFDGRSAVRTWLYAIAVRLASRHRRGAMRWLRALGTLGEQPQAISANPEGELERARASAAVHEVLARLPFKQREVLALYELEELEGAAIAELLDIPVNTVWTRLHHGRKRFEQLVRERIQRAP